MGDDILTRLLNWSYAAFAVSQSTAGIGVPKLVGAQRPILNVGAFFVSDVIHVYGGLRGASLGRAGAYKPVRQPCVVRLHSDWRQIETALQPLVGVRHG